MAGLMVGVGMAPAGKVEGVVAITGWAVVVVRVRVMVEEVWADQMALGVVGRWLEEARVVAVMGMVAGMVGVATI